MTLLCSTSSHILKYKEWQDAEYRAEGIDVNTMRLPVNGVFAEREAMANVWITHKGGCRYIGHIVFPTSNRHIFRYGTRYPGQRW